MWREFKNLRRVEKEGGRTLKRKARLRRGKKDQEEKIRGEGSRGKRKLRRRYVDMVWFC